MRGKDGKLIEANIKWQVVQVLRGKMVKVLRGSCKQEQMVQRRSSRGRSKGLWNDGEDRGKLDSGVVDDGMVEGRQQGGARRAEE